MKKQRLLFFAVLYTCFLPVLAYAAPTITVSATGVTLLGTSQPISITLTLIDPNSTGNLRVSGTGIVPIFTASTVTPGGTATVGPVYGNDVIIDAFGNLNSTYYKVQVFTVSNGIIASTPSLQNFYAFTGSGTVDLSTATPLAPSFMTGTAGSVSMPGSLSVTGTLGVSGAFTAGTDNSVLWVGPGTGQFSTFAAAVTAAGSVNKTIIDIASNYAGTCPAATLYTTNTNIFVNDWSGRCTPSTPSTAYQGCTFNFFDGNVQSGVRCGTTSATIPAAGVNTTGYFITDMINWTAGTGAGEDGISGEVNLFGTGSGTIPTLQAAEHDITVASTGGTVTAATPVIGYVNTGVGSTTAVGTVRGIYGRGCNSILGSVPTNCYGVYAEDQFGKGSVQSYALVGGGLSLMKFGGAIKSGFDMEDNSHVAHSVLYVDNNTPGSVNLQMHNDTGGINFNRTSGALQMQLIPNFFRIGVSVVPTVAGAVPIGTTSLPWSNIVLGTANTNNFNFVPAATAAGVTVNIADPGTPTVNLALVLKGTSAGFATATTAGTCVQNVTAVTGATTAMAVSISPVSTPGVGAVWSAFVSSAGNVTINECAVAASAGGTIAFNIRVFP